MPNRSFDTDNRPPVNSNVERLHFSLTDDRTWPVTVTRYKPHPTARIPTNPGIAPRIASKNNRSRAG